MRTGAKGIALIKQFEGCELTSYKCPAGVWTIGYGSTGPHVSPRMVISQAEADAMLAKDLIRFEAAVTKYTAGHATQNQFDALVAFAFNVGAQALKTSTLLRKHNEGDYAGAKAQFGRWTKAAGKTLPGLVRRRAAEAALYAA